jgi:hypothetical protein
MDQQFYYASQFFVVHNQCFKIRDHCSISHCSVRAAWHVDSENIKFKIVCWSSRYQSFLILEYPKSVTIFLE